MRDDALNSRDVRRILGRRNELCIPVTWVVSDANVELQAE